jgi:quercetin dioxygenase-like cupin family protein
MVFMKENMLNPLDVASNVYKLKMENERVRVLNVTFHPGDKAVMHSHPDHVVYVLEGGKMKLTSQGKNDIFDLVAGDTIFLKAQSHEAENIGYTTLDLLVVELKK